MEDIRIKKLKEKLDIALKLLSDEKEKTNFDKNTIDYRKAKKKAKKIKNELNETDDPIIAKKKKLELSNAENEIKKILVKFKTVSEREKIVFLFKQKIDDLIISIDYRKNKTDVNIKKIENKIHDTKVLIEKKYKTKLENEKSKAKILIQKLEEEIELKKTKGDFFSKEKEELRKQKIILKNKRKLLAKIKKADIYESKRIIDESMNSLKHLEVQSYEYKNQIDLLLSYVSDIDKALTFLDKDISKDKSFEIENLNVYYGNKQALFDINVELPKNKVIAVIGPSGCGKSTFLRTLNRINDNIPSFRAKGRILLEGEYDIFKLKSIKNRYDKMELATLRTRVGMIFQQPNPFPMSIAKNVQFGPKINGLKNKVLLNELTEQSLKDAGLWNEVKDNLKALGNSLSGGQQQRLCIARAIANKPEILLMDEPTSALDPIATQIIEDLILKLKKQYTIIMVTHSMQQAQRISDNTAFFYQGKLIEYGETEQLFNSPKKKETKDYISGKFG